MTAVEAMVMPEIKAANIKEKGNNRDMVREEHCVLARSVKNFLDNNLDKHVTIKQLSVMFHSSQTQLKCSFKDTYGMSVYSYSRAQKMKDAARMLGESSLTVLEIAGKYGYNNGSKFAKAFRDVIGVSPKQYRQNIQKYEL